jgi:hypothetical protein
MVELSTPTKKSLYPVQRSSFPEVGTKVWVPWPRYAGDRDSGDIVEYRPKQLKVLAVGVEYVILSDGPEQKIKLCRKTKDACRRLCGEMSLGLDRKPQWIM